MERRERRGAGHRVAYTLHEEASVIDKNVAAADGDATAAYLERTRHRRRRAREAGRARGRGSNHMAGRIASGDNRQGDQRNDPHPVRKNNQSKTMDAGAQPPAAGYALFDTPSREATRIDWAADELRLHCCPSHPRLNEAVDCCA